MNEEFNRDRFLTALGTNFKLTAADGQIVDIKLSEVSELRERPHQISYSIVFLVPENYQIDQGLYDLEHPDLGATQLFLVPIMPVGNQFRLEAVFNFLREQKESSTG